MTSCDVAIIVPPFAHAGYPAVGPSLLKAGCLAFGVRLRVLYGSLELAARAGYTSYNQVSVAFDEELVGERLFRAAAFPDEFGDLDPVHLGDELAVVDRIPATAEELSKTFLRCRPRVDRRAVVACAGEVASFVEVFTAKVLATDARIVGFSSVSQQTLSSIALARRLKAARPELVTVLGGGNASSPMGGALAELTGVFDFVFSGEADLAFPRFCRDFLERGILPTNRVVACPPLADLDQAAMPDYDDYFDQVGALVDRGAIPDTVPYRLNFEAARGCWWGERSRCTFCGLDGEGISYRHKSPQRVAEELAHLYQRYGVQRLHATDNILPRQFRMELLPALTAAAIADYRLFWEIRPDVPEKDLDLFVMLGLTELQPGIESFATPVLNRLKKGTTAIRNIVFLRDCRSRGIHCYWNLLVAVPGETADDYEAMIRLIPFIEHLQAPWMVGPVRIDRFSPLHDRAEEYGLHNVQPFPVYHKLFPDRTRLHDLVPYFVADYDTELSTDDELQSRFAQVLFPWIVGWQDSERPTPVLGAIPLADDLVLIKDTRSCAVEPFQVVADEVDDFLRELERPVRCFQVDTGRRQLLDELLQSRYVVEHEGYYVSVVTRPMIGERLHRELEQGIAGCDTSGRS